MMGRKSFLKRLGAIAAAFVVTPIVHAREKREAGEYEAKFKCNSLPPISEAYNFPLSGRVTSVSGRIPHANFERMQKAHQ